MAQKRRNRMKWEASVPIKKPDNILGAPTFRYLTPFSATHLSTPEDLNMYWLLGWEYGRMWFADHKVWEKKMYVDTDKGKIINKIDPNRKTKKKKIEKK